MDPTPMQSPPPAGETPSPISALLSNPALLQGLGAILKSGTTPSTPPLPPPEGEGTAPLPAIDPQLLSRLPQMMSMISALQKPLPPPPTGDRNEAREALLCALKPFLSPARANAIDALLRLLRLSRAMGNLK